jgi:glycosyltransferase involved in cell wall biosynthesis
MRIVIIAPPWVPVPPTGYGGTERVVDDLCRALAERGHDVLLYATGDSTCPVEVAWTYERALGTERASAAAELRHVTDAYDAALGWGADVVHDHTMSGPFYAERFRTLPVVTTNHGPFDGDLAALYARLAERVPVIAISHHQARTARDIPVAAVIHHGIDLDSFPLGTGRGGHALFLGRMNPDKGLHTAIRVAREAGIPLRIAAKMRERPEFEYFEERIKPQLGGAIEYLGEVGGAAKHALIGDAACLLNPIQWPEPFGMVMVEALACGTPVVTTSAGAAPEIVDDGVTGFLRNDEASLITALGYVTGLDRTACRSAAEARFSARRMADEHVTLFDRVVDRRRSRTLAAVPQARDQQPA